MPQIIYPYDENLIYIATLLKKYRISYFDQIVDIQDINHKNFLLDPDYCEKILEMLPVTPWCRYIEIDYNSLKKDVALKKILGRCETDWLQIENQLEQMIAIESQKVSTTEALQEYREQNPTQQGVIKYLLNLDYITKSKESLIIEYLSPDVISVYPVYNDTQPHIIINEKYIPRLSPNQLEEHYIAVLNELKKSKEQAMNT